MSTFTAVDLTRLPAPAIVEALDFETIFAAMLADLRARDPQFSAVTESDPVYKLLQVCAYRELHIRQRVNEAARGVMLNFAVGSDLDQLGANVNVQRLLLDAGDPLAIPPRPAVYESDSDFRERIRLSFEGYTTAGSQGSYVFHAISASGDVKDASATSPAPTQVVVSVLARTGNGTPSQTLLDTVEAALNAEYVRPMTDQVSVVAATIVNYAIAAELTMYPGPDSNVVKQAAIDAAMAYAGSVARIGYDVTRSGIFRALHQPGVKNVTLTSPDADIAIADGQASHCTGVTVNVADLPDV